MSGWPHRHFLHPISTFNQWGLMHSHEEHCRRCSDSIALIICALSALKKRSWTSTLIAHCSHGNHRMSRRRWWSKTNSFLKSKTRSDHISPTYNTTELTLALYTRTFVTGPTSRVLQRCIRWGNDNSSRDIQCSYYLESNTGTVNQIYLDNDDNNNQTVARMRDTNLVVNECDTSRLPKPW